MCLFANCDKNSDFLCGASVRACTYACVCPLIWLAAWIAARDGCWSTTRVHTQLWIMWQFNGCNKMCNFVRRGCPERIFLSSLFAICMLCILSFRGYSGFWFYFLFFSLVFLSFGNGFFGSFFFWFFWFSFFSAKLNKYITTHYSG